MTEHESPSLSADASQPAPSHQLPSAGVRRASVRWGLIICAAGLAAAAAGFHLGQWTRSWAAGQADSSATDPQAESSEPEKPAAWAPIPELPPPTDAKALIDETTRAVEQLVGDYPNEPDALEMKARLLRWLGDSQGASKIWEECLKQNPRYAYALVGLAAVAAEKGAHDRAAELAEKASQAEPSNFQARSLLAEARIQLGQPEKAVAVLEEYLKTDPRSQGFFLLGQACFQLGRYEQSKQNYEAAIRKYPDYVQAYHGLSLACERLGQREAAQQASDKFRKLGAPEESAKRIRGGRTSDLQTTSNEAAVIFTDVGRLYLVREKVREAETLWLRAATLNPKNVECRQSLAFLCRQTGRLGETVGWLRELAGLDPHNPSYHVEVGRLCEQLSSPDAAEQAYRQACEAAPESAEGYAALADLYLRYGHKPEETLALAQSAVKYRNSAPNYAMLSAARRATGDTAGALEAIEQALKLAPQSASYAAVRDSLKAEK